jgi:DNA recombination protein RmuC
MKHVAAGPIVSNLADWATHLEDGSIIAAVVAVFLFGLAALAVVWARRRSVAATQRQQQHLDAKLALIQNANAELTGRLTTMSEVLTSRQSDLARFVADRLDFVGARVGQDLDATSRVTVEKLATLNERLAIIDSAQARITGLTQEIIGLKDILANKQSRGAFGQGRMEAIVRDGLPTAAYEFQATLSNGTRPDCIIRLPGDERAMVVDAKFPLEAFTAFRDAKSGEQRRAATQRVRADVARHVKDIGERYLLQGETQDLALLFVPSESIYADLNEHFDDVVQKAHRARVVIVSPSLLMMAIQIMQAIVRDAQMREQAHLIQSEVRKIIDDVGRLRERVAKLDQHFHQAHDFVGQIVTSTDKIVRRGQRIDALDFERTDTASETSRPTPVKLRQVAD